MLNRTGTLTLLAFMRPLAPSDRLRAAAANKAATIWWQVGYWSNYVSALSEARLTRRVERNKGLGRAFDKAVHKEAARGCGGPGMLWKFNRFLPEKPCQTGTLAKTLLLMLIDVGLPAICVILPPAPSVLQEDSSDACVNTRGSARRASGFVLTGNPEVIPR
jgi:hypothetical protein